MTEMTWNDWKELKPNDHDKYFYHNVLVKYFFG